MKVSFDPLTLVHPPKLVQHPLVGDLLGHMPIPTPVLGRSAAPGLGSLRSNPPGSHSEGSPELGSSHHVPALIEEELYFRTILLVTFGNPIDMNQVFVHTVKQTVVIICLTANIRSKPMTAKQNLVNEIQLSHLLAQFCQSFVLGGS